jgi:small redox-active disulfide protein 2
MIIQVLGPCCLKCKKLAALAALTEQAVKETGIAATVEKITDLNVIVGFGVMLTPALAVDGVVKVSGRVPKIEEIKAWIGAT